MMKAEVRVMQGHEPRHAGSQEKLEKQGTDSPLLPRRKVALLTLWF